MEKILCAAIWFNDGNYYKSQPLNIDIGMVLCGFRHDNIFQQIGGLVGERKKLGISKEIQGFLTDKNRFVNREEAAEIAFNSGQITTMKKRLLSQDLY